MKAAEKMQKLRDELNSALVEREDQVEAMLAAILSRSHVLLLGPPGTAKSMLAEKVCEAIEGASYFKRLLTKLSAPEEVLGPFSLKGLKNDKFERVTTGKLPEAHISFLDEIFKCNSALLNSLLAILNEREFDNDGGTQACPLETCVGASNELPQGEELGALYDRFLLKFWVEPIQSDDAWTDLLCGNLSSEVTTKLTLNEIKEMQEAVKKVKVTKEFVNVMREIHQVLKSKGVTASDRRWKQAVKVMQAYAYLRGESEVTNDELEVLADILWEKPEDRSAIYTEVSMRANPLNAKAVEYMDAAKEAYDAWKENPDNTDVVRQSNGIIKEIEKKIEEDMVDRPKNKTHKLSETLKKARALRKEIVSSLGI